MIYDFYLLVHPHTCMHSFTILSVSPIDECATDLGLCEACTAVHMSVRCSPSSGFPSCFHMSSFSQRQVQMLTVTRICLLGLVRRSEPNAQQTREEETVRGRHTDRDQSSWIRAACSACKDQQQVYIYLYIYISDHKSLFLTNTLKTHTSVNHRKSFFK